MLEALRRQHDAEVVVPTPSALRKHYAARDMGLGECLMAVDSQVRRHMPRFHSDLHEGIRQTDEQLFGKERSRTVQQQKLADQKLYNPLYWAMLLLSVPFFLLGRWVHLPCGQGDAVRDDESEMEYEIRTLWIYGSDSFFFLGLVYAGVSASWQAAHDDFEGANATFFLISVSVYGGFLLCNTLLLSAMRRRDALQMRMQIAGTASFACVILALFVVAVVGVVLDFSGGKQRRDPVGVTLQWLLRCMVVLFYPAMALQYARMWRAYDEPRGLGPGLYEPRGLRVRVRVRVRVRARRPP